MKVIYVSLNTAIDMLFTLYKKIYNLTLIRQI